MAMKLILVLICVSLHTFTHGFQCPGDGHFANLQNKHSFYQCAHGIFYLMQCPAGLVWNQQIKVCDWDTSKPTINCDHENQRNCRETTQWATKGISLVGRDREFGYDGFHLGSPFSVYVDRERSNVYIADTGNHRVQKFNLKVIGSAGITVAGGNKPGNGSNQLNMPWAIYVDKNENVYVADTDNSRIQMWAKGTTSGVTVAGGNGKGRGLNQIGACQGIFVHEETNALYISDFYNDRIVKWIPEKGEGVIVAGIDVGGSAANQLSGPRGIFVDECETIYIADLWNNRIQKWKKDAIEGITVAGGNGQGSGVNQLSSPWDVEIDQYGNIYVADTDNNRVLKWAPGATSGVVIADGNGWLTDSNKFSGVYSIGLDKEGNLFVVEKNNHRLQQFNIMSGTNNC